MAVWVTASQPSFSSPQLQHALCQFVPFTLKSFSPASFPSSSLVHFSLLHIRTDIFAFPSSKVASFPVCGNLSVKIPSTSFRYFVWVKTLQTTDQNTRVVLSSVLWYIISQTPVFYALLLFCFSCSYKQPHLKLPQKLITLSTWRVLSETETQNRSRVSVFLIMVYILVKMALYRKYFGWKRG